MRIKTLGIELNRACNLDCKHCMYGRDRLDGSTMTPEIMDEIFSTFDDIGTLYIVGGEPFMSPGILQLLLDRIEQHGSVHELTLITNGTIMTEKIADVLNQIGNALHEQNKGWKIECPMNGCQYDGTTPLVYVRISSDEFHENDPETALDYYCSRVNNHVSFSIDTGSFGHVTDVVTRDNVSYIVNSGNARTLTGSYVKLNIRKNNRIQLSFDGACPHYDICDNLVVNQEGLIVLWGDGLRYDNPENIICRIGDDLPEAIKAWNKQYPMLGEETRWMEIFDAVINRGYLNIPFWKWRLLCLDYWRLIDKAVAARKTLLAEDDIFSWHMADDLTEEQRARLEQTSVFDDPITPNNVFEHGI